MTSIGAGLRLTTSNTVPTEFAHGHMTGNLALDPSQVPSHTARFDDAPPERGRRTVNICINDPICGVVRLGYMTLDLGQDHEASQGHGDGHFGTGADQASGAHDRQTGPRPDDPYLRQLIEEGRRTATGLAGSGDDHGLVPYPPLPTYAEAFRTIQAVMDDSKHQSNIMAVLHPSDLRMSWNGLEFDQDLLASSPKLIDVASNLSEGDFVDRFIDIPGNLNPFGFPNDPYTGKPSFFFPPIPVAPLAGAAAIGAGGTAAVGAVAVAAESATTTAAVAAVARATGTVLRAGKTFVKNTLSKVRQIGRKEVLEEEGPTRPSHSPESDLKNLDKETADDSASDSPELETPPSNQTRLTPDKLPADPDKLLDKGYNETSHPKAAATGRRTFENPTTGDKIEFDQGRPGENGFRKQDHYHWPNPNATGKRDYYLDKNGQPTPDGSKASHLLPGELN